MSDCYNTADTLVAKPNLEYFRRLAMSMDFQGVSDASGLAVLSNLPAEVQQLAVEHPVFTLPISQLPDGRKHREASFTLVVGRTNRLTLRLERKEESEITHY